MMRNKDSYTSEKSFWLPAPVVRDMIYPIAQEVKYSLRNPLEVESVTGVAWYQPIFHFQLDSIIW